MSADQPQKLNGVRGTVERGVYAAGSKSEHAAFFLVTANRRYLLRRRGAPPYNDLELAKFENQQVTCDGLLADKLLLAENIQIVDES